MGGGPRGRNVISTEGNARALHFSPAPTGLHRTNFHRPGLGPVLGFSLCLYFRHPSIQKLPRWWKQHKSVLLRLSRAARQCLVSSSSREPSAQLKSSASNTGNTACHKAPAKVINMNVSGENSKEIFELFTNKLVFSVSVSKNEESDDDPDLPSPH